MAYGEQKVKLPPGATLIEEESNIKLPKGATLISSVEKKNPSVTGGTTSQDGDGATPSTTSTTKGFGFLADVPTAPKQSNKPFDIKDYTQPVAKPISDNNSLLTQQKEIVQRTATRNADYISNEGAVKKAKNIAALKTLDDKKTFTTEAINPLEFIKNDLVENGGAASLKDATATFELVNAYFGNDASNVPAYFDQRNKNIESELSKLQNERQGLSQQRIQDNPVKVDAGNAFNKPLINELTGEKTEVVPDDIKSIDSKIFELKKYQHNLKDAQIKLAKQYAAWLKPDADLKESGYFVRKLSGDKSADIEQEYESKNIPLLQEQQYNNEKYGLSVKYTQLEQEYEGREKDDAYYDNLLSLNNFSTGLMNKYPEYKKQQGANLIAQLAVNDPLVRTMASVGSGELSKESINYLSRKYNIPKENLKGIDLGDVPHESIISNVLKGVYNAGTGLLTGAVRASGTALGIDEDRLTYVNEGISGSGNEVFGDNPYQHLVQPDTFVNPQSLEPESNPNAGKYNYNAATIKNAVSSGIGQFAGFLLGLKTVGTLGKVADVALTEDAVMNAYMIGSGYENNYQKGGAVMGADASEFSKSAYATTMGYIDALAFKVLPKDKIFMTSPEVSAATKDLAKTLEGQSISSINRELLQTKVEKVLEGVVGTTKETAKVGGAMSIAELAKGVVDSVVGKDEEAGNLVESINNISSIIKDLPLSMAIPLGVMEIPKMAKHSSNFKESIYDAGLSPDTYTANLNQLHFNGLISQEQLNSKLQVVNTMRDIVKSIPSENPLTNEPLSHTQMRDYAYNRSKEIALKAKAEGIKGDEALSELYLKRAKELADERADIISKKTPDEAPPVYKVDGKEQPSSTVSSEVEGSGGVGGDVESTTKALEDISKNKPTIWQSVKDAFNKGVNKVFGGSLKMKDSEKLSPDKIKVRVELIAQKLGATIEYKPHPLGAAFNIANDGKFYITIDPKLFDKGLGNQEAFNTINVIAHELGHAIDAKEVLKNNLSDTEISELAKLHRAFINTFNFDVGEDISGLETAIKNNNKNITGDEKATKISDLRNPETNAHRHEQEELFADALRMMVISPELAKRLAPNLFERLSKHGLGDNEHQSIAEAYHDAKSKGIENDFTKAVEQSLKEQHKAETPQNKPTVSSEVDKRSDADIEKRMSELEDSGLKIGMPETKEFNSLEKEMEKRERATVFDVPLEKVNDAVNALMKKEKEQPNGYGAFIEKRDARETKEVADKYSNPKDISDAELKKDFKEAVLGNPDTWYADGLKLRESMKEAANRGIDIKEMIATIEKEYIRDGYSAKDAHETVARKLKPIFENKPIQNESKVNEVQQSAEVKEPATTEPNKEIESASEGTGGKEPPNKDFDKMTSNIPSSGEVKKYLSGETILENQPNTELRNPQEYVELKLNEALKHGVETIEKAKEIFGNEYVEKTLEYIEKNNLPIENKSLLYVTLENEMAKRVAAEPNNVGLKKIEDLVRSKSQAFLRSNSKAINMGRLRAFAKTGFDISKITDKFFSSKELEEKAAVEKLVQADADKIQRQAEENAQQSTAPDFDLEQKVREGVDAEITKLYDALPKEKKTAADKAIAALDKVHDKLRNKAYESTLGIPLAIIDAGVVTIRAALKAGVRAAKAVEMGIEKIKEKYGKDWANENEFRKDYLDGLREQGVIDAQQRRQAEKEYRMLETERNRQLAKVGDLTEKLNILQKGERPTVNSKEVKLDVPEIEALKKRVKEETQKLNALDAQQRRIDDLEAELERLQNRKPKENNESVPREVSKREAELKDKIKSEKEIIRNESRLSNAKEKVQEDIDNIRKEIIEKEREQPKAKNKVQADQELTRLREQKKSIESLRDKYLPRDKDPYADKKEVDRAKGKLTSDIAEINRQINDGKKDAKGNTQYLSNTEIKKLKKEKEIRQSILEAIDPTPKEFVQNALIEQGFGKTVKIKTKNGVEERQVLDWKKLAGEEGSVDKISDNVGKVLEKNGFTPEQLGRMSDAFIKEYTDLRASVIEKGLNEMAARNKTTVSPLQKSAAKKLAEMYNYGLFDKDPVEYETTLAKTIGIDRLNDGRATKVRELGEAMASLYSTDYQGKRLTESQMRTAIQVVEEKMRELLHAEANKHGSTPLKLADMVRTYMDASQRMTLNNLKQALENPLSGLWESLYSTIGYSKSSSGKLSSQQLKSAAKLYKEMVVQKGVGYGNVSTTFVNKGNLEMQINKMSNNKLFHGVASTLLGRTTLDAVDSFYKSKITQQKFVHNLVKILQQDRKIGDKIEKGMSKEDAKKYVAEKLTGQSFTDAKATAKKIIDKANAGKEKKIFNDSPEFVDRLANDIVTAALVNGEKITEEMVTAAYNAAYKAAGRGLGHVANNFISQAIGTTTGKIESRINDAIKEKEYNKAAALTMQSILYRNIANPFVGGGTNWVVLKAEKTGLGLLSGLGSMMEGGRKMDLTSEAGIKKLEQAMYQNLKVKDKFIRGTVGAMVTALSALAFAGITSTDEYRKWRSKNMWAARYLDTLTPEVVLSAMAVKDDKMKRYLESTFNQNEQFDKTKKIIKGTVAAFKGDTKTAAGQTGEVMGGIVGFPVPWRLVRDGQQIFQGTTGDNVYKVDNRPSQSVLEGYFKGGLVDYLGFAPEQQDPLADQKNNPVFKKYLDKEIKLPLYEPDKIQTKEVNGKVVEHLSDYEESVQKEYKVKAEKYLTNYLKDLEIGKIKVYVDKNGTASTPTTAKGKEGKTRKQFKDLTKEQLNNVIHGSGGIIGDVTEKLKEEVLKGKKPKVVNN